MSMRQGYTVFQKITAFLEGLSSLGQSGVAITEHRPDRIICTISNFGSEFFASNGGGITEFVKALLNQLGIKEYTLGKKGYKLKPPADKDYTANYCGLLVGGYAIHFRYDEVEDSGKQYPVYKLTVVFEIGFHESYKFLKLINQ